MHRNNIKSPFVAEMYIALQNFVQYSNFPGRNTKTESLSTGHLHCHTGPKALYYYSQVRALIEFRGLQSTHN